MTKLVRGRNGPYTECHLCARHMIGTLFVVPILQMGKLRLWEAKLLIEGHSQ